MNHPLLRPIVVATVPGRLAPRHLWSGGDQALPVAGGPCTREDCGHSCWWQHYRMEADDAWYWRDVTVHHADAGDVDGEGPCQCGHHEDAGVTFRHFMYGIEVSGLPWGTSRIES